MRDEVDTLVRNLQQELGEDLRGVFWGNFADENYTVAYLHEDVRRPPDLVGGDLRA